jgi:hypothetical protein
LDIASPESPEGLATLVFHFNSINMASGQDGNKKPMFISDVQIVNGPNGEIPSLARLYRVEHEPKEIRAGNVYLSLREASFQLFDGLPDGKFGPIIDCSGNQPFDRLEPSIVQSAM